MWCVIRLPSVVGKQTGVEGQRDGGHFRVRILKRKVLRVAEVKLVNASGNDDKQGQQLRREQ